MLLSPKTKTFFFLTQLLLLGESLPVLKISINQNFIQALQTEIFDVLPLMMINSFI
jgi:hypothetical protein